MFPPDFPECICGCYFKRTDHYPYRRITVYKCIKCWRVKELINMRLGKDKNGSLIYFNAWYCFKVGDVK